MNSDLPSLVFALVAGGLISLFYFGGLWWTVRQVPHVKNGGMLLLASFIGRAAITLAGFYLAADGRWERLLACLAGFILVRAVMVRRLGLPSESDAAQTQTEHMPGA
jgi:F1F0 ATPase subunit 2